MKASLSKAIAGGFVYLAEAAAANGKMAKIFVRYHRRDNAAQKLVYTLEFKLP